MDKNLRILLVDDEPGFTQVMSFWFESRGYSVSIAKDGEEGIKMFKDERPDALFLDVVLPDIDGFELLEQIKKLDSNMPIIMMSAYVDKSKTDNTANLRGSSGLFYKDEGFPAALKLLQSALPQK